MVYLLGDMNVWTKYHGNPTGGETFVLKRQPHCATMGKVKEH